MEDRGPTLQDCVDETANEAHSRRVGVATRIVATVIFVSLLAVSLVAVWFFAALKGMGYPREPVPATQLHIESPQRPNPSGTSQTQ